MSLFLEMQFPVDLSIGVKQGPMFQTIINAFQSGHETRVGQWDMGRMKFDAKYSVKTEAQMMTVVAFFRVVRGRLYGFRFKDWTDFEVTDEGLTNPYPDTIMQLTKTYDYSGNLNVRDIVKPVAGSYTIYENLVAITEGTDYTLDTTTGIVTFLGAKPVSGANYIWTGQFDVPVRFDTDQLFFENEDSLIMNLDSIPMLEVQT